MPSEHDEVRDRERRLDEIILAYLNAADAGSPADRSVWLARHPEFATDLQEFFANQDQLEQMAAPLRGVAETASRAWGDTEPSMSLGEPAEPLAYPSLGNYQLLSAIARGGMGIVFRARQITPDRLVAIKMIHAARLASSADIQRFRNEAETVAALDHPNIVPILEVGEHRLDDLSPPVLYFSMKLMEGGSLAKGLVSGQLRFANQEGERRAAELVATIARAVHYAHQRGVLHRDLKPANILFDAAGRPHVSDFGLAKRVGVDASLTESGAIIGTPSYMAPELALPAIRAGSAAPATTATDVYSLGAILYFVLTGRAPFEADTLLETLDQVLRREPEPPRRLQPALNWDLETICLKCLRKEPEQRYQSAEALAEDLERWSRGEPILARPVGRTERAWRWCRRNPHLAIVGTVAIAALLGGTITSTIFAVRADRAATLARQRSQLAEALLAEQFLDRALSACSEENDLGRGLHWLLFALESCPEDRPDLEWAIRLQLAAWGIQVPRLQTILTTPGPILSAAISPDGRYFATGGEDKTARLWEVASRKLVEAPFAHPGRVLRVAFSPDGKKVLTGCDDHVARFWEVPTGWPVGPVLQQKAPVYALAFAPDGKTVLTGEDQMARMWDAGTGSPLGEPLRHEALVHAATFSPNGKTILTAGRENITRLWDRETKKAAILQPKTWVNSAAFSDDGRSILTANDDHTARLWDAMTLQPIGPILKHQGAVSAIAFLPDGGVALTGSADTTARIWDPVTGRPLSSPLRHAGGVNGVAFAPDGRTIWSAGGDLAATLGEIRVWQLPPEAMVPFSSSEKALVKGIAFSADGQKVATGNTEGEVQVRDVASGRTVTWKHETVIDAVAFPPDGRIVLTAGLDGKACLWDALKGQQFGRPMNHKDRIRSAAFSPDGKMILTAGGGRDAVANLAASDQHEIKLWDTSTQEPIGLPVVHPHAVVSVAFSPDGTKFATSRGVDNLTQVWDSATREKVGPAFGHHHGWVWSMAFSPDGQKLLTGSLDYNAQQWDVATGEPIGPPLKHPSRVWGVAYSPDGRIILTGCMDGAARLWDPSTGKPLGPPLWHPGPVGCVAFHPDGWSFATGSSEDTVRFWPVPRPLAGSVDHLRLEVQVATGFEMDTQGGITVLKAAEWQERRDRLE